MHRPCFSQTTARSTRYSSFGWTKGDIDVLVNDSTSNRGLPSSPDELPESLLNSRRMYVKLLDAFDGMDDSSLVVPDSPLWHRFYQSYLTPIPIKIGDGSGFLTTTPSPQRAFGDGGYLDNKPFSYAIDALLQRDACLPVERKLVHVEPSPEHPERDGVRVDKPDAIANTLAALTTIPRYESIREDLQRIMAQNETRLRVNRILDSVLQSKSTDQVADTRSPMGDEYLRLRATTAVDAMTRLGASCSHGQNS